MIATPAVAFAIWVTGIDTVQVFRSVVNFLFLGTLAAATAHIVLSASRLGPIITILFSGTLLIFLVGIGAVGYQAFVSHDGVPCLLDANNNPSNEVWYFSVVTMTTLGYGDLHPVGPCKYYAAMQALTGMFFFPIFVVALVESVRQTEKFQSDSDTDGRGS
ncbi:MAG: ion channel [Hyphomicrobiaceae bacterium]